MKTNIDLPTLIYFYDWGDAADFADKLKELIPRIKFQELVGANGYTEYGEDVLFVFFTRKDRYYKDIVRQAGGIVENSPQGSSMLDHAIDMAAIINKTEKQEVITTVELDD